jgi:hypothetical protein
MVNEYQKAYRQANKERIKQQRHLHYEANKDVIKAKAKAYQEAHQQERAAYLASNKEHIQQREKDYYAKKRLYKIWRDMNNRCYNPRLKNFERYGARGIIVCNEWRDDYSAFERWALTNGYAPDLTIDRINNDGNYEPGNCQWLTMSENIAKANKERKLNPSS